MAGVAPEAEEEGAVLSEGDADEARDGIRAGRLVGAARDDDDDDEEEEEEEEDAVVLVTRNCLSSSVLVRTWRTTDANADSLISFVFLPLPPVGRKKKDNTTSFKRINKKKEQYDIFWFVQCGKNMGWH